MEEREKIDQENQPSIGDSLKVVLSNKGVWLVSICIMMALGSNLGCINIDKHIGETG